MGKPDLASQSAISERAEVTKRIAGPHTVTTNCKGRSPPSVHSIESGEWILLHSLSFLAAIVALPLRNCRVQFAKTARSLTRVGVADGPAISPPPPAPAPTYAQPFHPVSFLPSFLLSSSSIHSSIPYAQFNCKSAAAAASVRDMRVVCGRHFRKILRQCDAVVGSEGF